METISIQDLVITVTEPSNMQQHNIDKHLKSLNISNINYCDQGQATITQLINDTPDLVISWLYLPDMTGIELVNSIRSIPEIENVLFMLVSSETAFNMLDPIRQAGVSGICDKPFETDIVKQLIKQMIAEY